LSAGNWNKTARLLSREVQSAKEAFSEQFYGFHVFAGKILVFYETVEQRVSKPFRFNI